MRRSSVSDSISHKEGSMLGDVAEIRKMVNGEVDRQVIPIKDDVKAIRTSVECTEKAVTDMRTDFAVHVTKDEANWSRLEKVALVVIGNGNHDDSHDGRLKRIERILEEQVVTKKGVRVWFEKPYITLITFALITFLVELISMGLLEKLNAVVQTPIP
jgi:hypothetical protein